MKTYIMRTLSLILVLAAQSANAELNVQLKWDPPTRGDLATEQFLLSMPQVGPFNLANTQESLDAFCTQVSSEAKQSLKIMGFQKDYKGTAVEKSGPTISAGAYQKNGWIKISNSEIVTVILCEPNK